jgi:preprotein translocase subunit SecE
MADKIKIVLAVLLLVAGIAAFYYWEQSPTILRVAAVLAGGAAGAAVFLTSAPGKEFLVFAQESVVETRKVVWPTREETLKTTGVVFLFVVVMSVFLWFVDAGLLWLVGLLMGQGQS